MARIEVRDLQVNLGGRTVLQHVDLSVADGELVYLLGRNGAGKSTLLRTLCGMVPPAGGSVAIDGPVGMHLGTDTVHPGHTARRHLRWFAAASGVRADRVDEVLARTGVDAYGDRRIGSYSLGMRQRLGIATALLPDADALVFDEPLNGLDVEGIAWLRELLTDLARDGRAVVVASHLLSEVERTADRIAVVDRRTATPAVPLAEFLGAHPDLESAYLAAVSPEVAA